MAVMPMGRQTDQEVEQCGYNACVKTVRSGGHECTRQETRCVLIARMEGPQSPLLSLCLQRWVFSLERLSCLPELQKPGEGGLRVPGLRVPGPGASRLRQCTSSSLFLTRDLTSWHVDPESSAQARSPGR